MTWNVRPGDVSRSVAAKQLKALMKKYNGICQYCFKKIPAGLQTREHIKRLIDGGTSDISNLTLACSSCNSENNAIQEDIVRITKSIQECIERQIKGLQVVGLSKVGCGEYPADTWPILIRKAIIGTVRRQAVGAVIVAAPPKGVECSSLATKKIRRVW